MGITDVDDKIIARARASSRPPLELASNFEHSFFDDMKLLGVREPNLCLRVSEHIDEIIKFVSNIIEQGFAYELNGDVWFDTKRFHNSAQHSYGKLPAAGFEETAITQADDKKPRRIDFALWKSAKPGDLYWTSPWGNGRPGWHIECSAMSTSAFGNTLDLHSGGIDLKFPHHTNEIAQCEAHYGGPWVKQFIHSGHLKIDGLKMSKSLKNFITVKDLLKNYSSDEYRMFCLMHHYSSSLSFSDDRMMDARNVIQSITKFQNLSRHVLATEPMPRSCRLSEADQHLQQYWLESRIKINKVLADDFNTRDCLAVFLDLISATNRLIRTTRISRTLLSNLLHYVEDFLSNLGFRCFSQSQSSQHSDTLNSSLKSLVRFRSEVRTSARSLLSSESAPVGKRLLALCDDLRDRHLKDAGVILQDLSDGSTTFEVERVFPSSMEQRPIARKFKAAAAKEEEKC